MRRVRVTRGLVWGGALLSALAGLAAGVGGFTFIYARGASYLTDDPKVCVNCHVMREQYDGWLKSSHHAVAVCNDCHTPHNFIGKYMTKGLNGYHHSMAFTFWRPKGAILITERNRKVAEGACRRCHQDIVRMIDAPRQGGGPHGGPPHGDGSQGQPIECIRCHQSVGHLE